MASTIFTLLLFFGVIFYAKKNANEGTKAKGKGALESFPSADQLDKMANSAQAEVREKWLQFNQQMHFAEGVPLSQKLMPLLNQSSFS